MPDDVEESLKAYSRAGPAWQNFWCRLKVKTDDAPLSEILDRVMDQGIAVNSSDRLQLQSLTQPQLRVDTLFTYLHSTLPSVRTSRKRRN